MPIPVRAIVGLSLTLTLALALSPAATSAADDNEVVARAGSIEIRSSEVRDILQSLDANARQQVQQDPTLLVRLLRSRLERTIVLDEARAKKWEQRQEIQALIDQARQQVVLTSYLAGVVKMPDNYPSESDLRALYDASKASLLKPGQFRLAQIFLALPASADKGVTDALQRRAEDLSRRARAKGADFGALAREASDHKESAGQGGDLGWLGAQQLLPEVRNAVGVMGKGEVSLPIRTPTGFHVIKLIDSKPSEVASFNEVREGLVNTLRQRKLEELQAVYVNGLLEKAGLALNEMALKKAMAP